MVDCGDAERLQRFCGELLGWERCRMYGCPAVRGSGGEVFLFAREPDYVPPVWPEEEGRQQKQMHFDFQVESVPEAVRRAEALGAVKAAAQFGGGEEFITMLDPAGHPFCLCRK
ncbi:MAG: VOC family protein [Oscillibacter sp.]|nr:VOC family protein [Oscillibacter sp.]